MQDATRSQKSRPLAHVARFNRHPEPTKKGLREYAGGKLTTIDATDIDERCGLEPCQIFSLINNTSADRQRH